MTSRPASVVFDDGKAPDALRTIGEVATGFGIKQHILRYWEQQFSMLQPLKRSGGRRYYRPEDVALVGQINQLVNDEGYTLKGALQVMESGVAPEAPAAIKVDEPAPAAPPAAGPNILPQLKAIRMRLANALAA